MRLDSSLPASGVNISVWATFTGWHRVPLLALATNSFSPLLRLYEDRVEFKVFRTHTRPFSDISCVDARRIWKTNQLIIEWRGEKLTFAANLLLNGDLEQLLVFFARKAVPMSSEARALRLLSPRL